MEEFKDINEQEESIELNEGSDDKKKSIRVKLPRGREIIGIITERLGGNKMRINCLDGKSRICRVPGRLKRRLWLRPDNVVIIEPWELDDSKGDVLYKYTPTQAHFLRKKGYLKKEDNEF
ncbi:MAG: translation initiation factor eIF-1A [Minisyncoccales bacterium]